MQRLTRVFDDWVEVIGDTTWYRKNVKKPTIPDKTAECIIRLSEYEDTGLTPEEVADKLEAMQWISVKDRLPKERIPVLCRCRAEIYDVLKLIDGDWHDYDRHIYMSGFVTHWMPLPTPPEEENNAKSDL